MYVERFLEKDIKKYLQDREIIAIVGARQCGKTTLMKRIFNELDNADFISFEDRDILNLFSNDIKSFVEKYVKGNDYLFIDEFQYAKEGGKNLKYIFDNYKTKIIISGSSAPELTIHSIKYLVGRVFVFTLYPFSFEEFLKFKDPKLYNLYKKDRTTKEVIELINKPYFEYFVYGGYPRVVLEEDYEKKKEILRNIFNTYLLREIKEIMQIHEDQKINQIIKALSLQIGGLVNHSKISSLTGISFNELKKYIEILKKTFVGIEVGPFFRNKRKELSKTSKFYFLDNGFRNISINDFREKNLRNDLGELNENFIASELIKQGKEPKYWRTKSKAEVDFVLEYRGKEIIPIEVKTSLHENKIKITRSFRNFVEEYKPKRGFVFSFNLKHRKYINKSEIRFLPLFSINKIFNKTPDKK